MPTSACTLWRWCIEGVYVRRVDRIIHLQHPYVGRRLLTTEAWLEEFIDQLALARTAEQKLRAVGNPGSMYDHVMELRWRCHLCYNGLRADSGSGCPASS